MNLVRGWAALLAAAMAVTLCSSQALADGKVFRQAVAPVPMVDQEAIIAFKDGVEVLAIRTRADTHAVGSEPMAWVVPVPGPSAPELLTTTEGSFATARAITQPRLINDGVGWFGPTVLIGSLLLLCAVAVDRLNPDVSGWQRKTLSVIFVFISFCFCVVLLLPTLGRSRSSAGPWGASAGVEVLTSQRVGTLDVSVVRAGGLDNGKGLAEWLTRAGCAVPPSAQPVIARYVAEGWVFVAARLAPGPGPARLEPTPLVMRFPVEKPVYPMRLTGIDNGPLTLDLTVIADGTASAPGLTVVRSSPAATQNQADPDANAVRLDHAGLASLANLAGNPSWITRLSGVLSPSQQQEDLALPIGGRARISESLWTPDAAASLGVNAGSIVAALGVVVLALSICLRQWTQRKAARMLAVCATVGCLSGFAIAGALPVYGSEVRLARRPSWAQSRAIRQMELADVHGVSGLREFVYQRRAEDDPYFKDLPPEGDVPWGYTLRADETGQVWVDQYNEWGKLSHSGLLFNVKLDAAR